MQPLLHWKSNKQCVFWVCVCSLRYPTFNAQISYCHLRPIQLYNIFPRYLISGTIYEKKENLLTTCFDFLYNFCPKKKKTFHLRRPERYMIRNVHWPSCEVPVMFVRFYWNLNFLHRFLKIMKYEISLKSVSGSRVVPYGRTAGHRQTWRS